MVDTWIWAWIGLALVLMPVQFIIAAPYGRHANTKWGPTMNSKAGWVIMELVALIAFAGSFLLGSGYSPVTIAISGLFILHYVHRSIIYPLMTRTGKKRMPIIIVLFAVVFNVVNGYINGDYLGDNADLYPGSYFLDARFVIGVLLFVVGAGINISSDYYLISLRKEGQDNKYYIPRGRLFRRLSCPNHFGEIVEWIGFAVMCWSLPGVAFAAWTITNLVPRAWQHHKWYRQKFADYPRERKAVLPWLL